MANTKVEINIATVASKEVYIIGSCMALGNWNPEKAVKLEYLEDKNVFHLSKLLPEGQLIEFKVLADKTWDSVEKGWYEEEVENHILTPHKGLVVSLEIPRFQGK
ncbi:MAG: hypothetical protein K2I42_06620 [Anaeroplasmataceae bacterium]|nr:hypothetical protein [Anaeroplasmataceae bacterium]